jgi:hypothetical protein
MPIVPDPAFSVRPELPDDPPPPFLFEPLSDPEIRRQADFFAWLADSADNHPEEYPGPGWDNPANWPAWTDAVRYAPGPRG